MNTQTQGNEPQYDVIHLDQRQTQRPQSHNYENAAAAEDGYATLNTKTLGEQPQYDYVRHDQNNSQRQNTSQLTQLYENIAE